LVEVKAYLSQLSSASLRLANILDGTLFFDGDIGLSSSSPPSSIFILEWAYKR